MQDCGGVQEMVGRSWRRRASADAGEPGPAAAAAVVGPVHPACAEMSLVFEGELLTSC